MRHEVLALIRDEERRTEAASWSRRPERASPDHGRVRLHRQARARDRASHGIGFAVARAFAAPGPSWRSCRAPRTSTRRARGSRPRAAAGARPGLRHHRPRCGKTRGRRAWRHRRAREQRRPGAAHADPRAGRCGRAGVRAHHRDQRDRHLLRHPRGGAADGPRRQRADRVDLGADRGGRVLRLRRLQAREHRLHAGAGQGLGPQGIRVNAVSPAGPGRARRCARSRRCRPAPA